MKCSQCSCETEKELPAFLPPFNRTSLDRLRAGYVPKSSIELSDIETFLQSAESSLADYEEDIRRLERTKRLREETIRAMHNARTLTSPIRKVPPEILCEIFANYIRDSAFGDPELESTDSDEAQAACPAIFLTWVCAFWRKLVLARPSFWSSIVVSIPSLLENPQQIHLLHHSIMQSANSPLDIIVVPDDRIYKSCDEPLTHSVYDILLENHPRWRRFSGGYSRHWEVHVERWLKEHSGSHLPYLEFLHWDSGEVFFALFKSCPQLKVFHGDRLSSMDPEHHHLFSHLTELSMRDILGPSIVDVLRQTPLLGKLTVMRIIPFALARAHLSAYCSNISTLCIGLIATECPECWEYLHLPFLKTLELGGPLFDPRNFSGDDADWKYQMKVQRIHDDVLKFAEVLANIGPVLETVKLDRVPGKEAIAFLALHPSISDLTLSIIYPAFEDIIYGIDISRDNPVILPNMRSLSISLINFEDSGYDYEDTSNDVTQLVKSRTTASICSAKGVVPLETFALEVKLRESYIGQDICERLSDRITVVEKDYDDFVLEFN